MNKSAVSFGDFFWRIEENVIRKKKNQKQTEGVPQITSVYIISFLEIKVRSN